MLMTPSSIAAAFTSPFVKLWHGEYSLPVAFWLFFLLGTILAPIVAMIIYTPFVLAGILEVKQPLAVIAMIIYPIFAAVGVWRSANARHFRRWPVAAAGAKLFVCIWFIGLASRATGMGLIDVLRLTGYRP